MMILKIGELIKNIDFSFHPIYDRSHFGEELLIAIPPRIDKKETVRHE